MRSAIATAIAFCLSAGPCFAADISCATGAASVPTQDAAKAIFRTEALKLAPRALNRFPVIVANDAGDYWTMAQTNGIPFYMPSPGPYGDPNAGTGVTMDINKCTGAISNVKVPNQQL